MAILDRLKPSLPDIPADVDERTRRGRARMREGAEKRNECLEFARGNQYCYVNKDNWLVQQGTVRGQNGKLAHNVRVTWNLLTPHLEHETAACTKQVPFYQINPSTTDPQDAGAADLAQKVAAYGYDAWDIKSVTEKVVALAIIADGGFAWPYFDNTIGAPIGEGDNGQVLCVGDVRVKTFSPNEVYWEPGVKFDDSRWHCVEQALPVETVYQLEGYKGGTLTPNASTSDVLGDGKKPQDSHLVLVTDYLERPSPKNTQGRRLVICQGKIICDEMPYPCVDAAGEAVDEPVLHYLTRIIDPDSDRDQGLVRHALDACRTWNDCTNKILEWKNLALMPQILAPKGAFQNKKTLTDEPGRIIEYVGTQMPQWRPVPEIPQGLFQLRDEAKEFIAMVFSQNEIPQGVDSGKALATLIERDDNTRQGFISRLAEFHSRLMRHCLYLVARHYTEGRLLKVRGDFGADPISDFTGADLRSQMDVRVLPDSIAPMTQQAAVDKVQWFVQMFPGAITPEKAMLAIQTGHSDELLQSFQKDRSRAFRVIQQIKAGPDVFMNQPDVPGPPVPDPVVPGKLMPGQPVPGWMPRAFDNVPVHKSIFEDYMKTSDYDFADDPVKAALNLYYEALLQLEAQKAAQAAQQQAMMAEQLGMQNAAGPQAKPLPSGKAIGG
jgi:hypothetical protein